MCFDTFAWIEYFAGSKVGARVAKEFVDDHEVIILTPVVCLTELEAKALKERRNIGNQLKFLAERSVLVSISPEIACRTAREKAIHGIATVDALIYACGLENNAEVVTGDLHLTALEQVIDVKKL
ncbi:hypothetical protein AUJ65_05055 [Candidatus Micrarchaeota archaeon CG1_02_51_15]|nr:MAG: hypothetical protein AUJ65_05055 [Candidatus Micrarchaeota archaeon CG1_02_51_15]